MDRLPKKITKKWFLIHCIGDQTADVYTLGQIHLDWPHMEGWARNAEMGEGKWFGNMLIFRVAGRPKDR